MLTHPLLKEHFKTVLVVCPLNVVNAWRAEIDQWVKRDKTIEEKFMVIYFLVNLYFYGCSLIRQLSIVGTEISQGGE